MSVCVYGEGFSLGVVFHICGPVEYDECAWHSLLSSVKRFNGISESERPSLSPTPAQTKLPLFSSPYIPIYLRVLPAHRPERRTFFEKGKCMCLTVAICSSPPPHLHPLPPQYLPLRGYSPNIGLLKVSPMCSACVYYSIVYIRTTTTSTTTTAAVAVAAVVEHRGAGGRGAKSKTHQFSSAKPFRRII